VIKKNRILKQGKRKRVERIMNYRSMQPGNKRNSRTRCCNGSRSKLSLYTPNDDWLLFYTPNDDWHKTWHFSLFPGFIICWDF